MVTYTLDPERKRQLDAGMPLPLPPPDGYQYLTDTVWDALRQHFKLREIVTAQTSSDDVNLRALLEWECRGLADSLRLKRAAGHPEELLRQIRWLSESGNVGAELPWDLHPQTKFNIVDTAGKLDIKLDRCGPGAVALTADVQLVAKILFELEQMPTLRHVNYGPTFVCKIAWIWENYLGRKPTLSASPDLPQAFRAVG